MGKLEFPKNGYCKNLMKGKRKMTNKDQNMNEINLQESIAELNAKLDGIQENFNQVGVVMKEIFEVLRERNSHKPSQE